MKSQETRKLHNLCVTIVFTSRPIISTAERQEIAMASMKAFAIPEILEMVLSQLPERDLLLDQRVNST